MPLTHHRDRQGRPLQSDEDAQVALLEQKPLKGAGGLVGLASTGLVVGRQTGDQFEVRLQKMGEFQIALLGCEGPRQGRKAAEVPRRERVSRPGRRR